MEQTTGKRLSELRKAKGLSVEEFAAKLGVKPSAVYGLQSDANKPSFDTLASIVHHFPDVSMDWLLTGAGPMLRDGRVLTPTVAAAPAEVPMRAVPDAAEVGYLKERIKDKDQIIEILREQLDTLRAYLPESLGKLLPDSFAAEPAARPTVGFVQSNVTMTCNGNTYTEARTEASTIWFEARKVA